MTGSGLRKLSMALIATVVAALGSVADAYAVFPGTNGPIAFTRGPGPASPTCSDDIWTMQPDGSGQTQITNTPDCESGPAWSPNGGLIAYARGTGRARATQEFLDDPFTSNCTHPPPGCDPAPEWDGQLVVHGGETPPPGNAPAGWPDWAPDGNSIAYNSNTELAATGYPASSGNSTSYSIGGIGSDPAFSPRGDAVAYTSFMFDGEGATWYAIAIKKFSELSYEILTPLRTTSYGATWSPDASRIAFTRDYGDIWVMNADGTDQQQVTSGTALDNFPTWSPDGTKIAFVRCCFTTGTTDLFTVEPDGSDVTRLTNDTTSEWDPNWKRATSGDPPGYARAKAARRVTVPLVPAYAQCQTPNHQHGPPLSFGSCAPPNRMSELLTFGTPDANGQPVNSTGSVALTSIPGNPATEPGRFVGDEADARIEAWLTDVRRASDLSDYAPNELLVLVLTMRRTDRSPYTPAGPPEAATGEDFTMRLSLNCFATPSSTEGARCTRTATTFDTIVPGFIREGHRTTWQIEDIRVEDAGLDNDLETTGDNRTLAVPGVFVP